MPPAGGETGVKKWHFGNRDAPSQRGSEGWSRMGMDPAPATAPIREDLGDNYASKTNKS